MINSPKAIRDDAVFLIDGSGYIFRAYFAIRYLSSSKGVPTNAVYGFTTMLLKLLKEHNPKYLAIAFDTGKPTFRHQIYKEYKANRPPAPEDLIPQFDLIQQLVEAFQIKKLRKEGYEADDLLGTATRIARESKKQVVIVTGDKDLMQLVDDDVWLLDELRAAKEGHELMIDRTQVLNKFGVGPENVVDILALAGDSSDNVPGVRGIGEKTAIELVKQFGSVENILKNANSISQKSRREKLQQDRDMALLSKRLVTIDCNVDYPITLSDFKNTGPNVEELTAFFKELEFKRLLDHPIIASTSSTNSSPKESAQSNYKSITSKKELLWLADQINKTKALAIDTETDSLDSLRANLVGISLCFEENLAFYIPIGHDFAACPTQIPLSEVIEVLDPILQNKTLNIYAQNAKYDLAVLVRSGFKRFEIKGDPMIASYLLDADTVSHSLDNLSDRYLNHKTTTYEEICGKGKKQIPFSAVALNTATNYAAQDADLTFRLAILLKKKIKREKLAELYHELELPLEAVLCEMEMSGIQVDTKKLLAMSTDFELKLAKLEQEAHKVADQEFNLASPKQVGEILFEKLGLKTKKKTKTGFSTNAQVLETLATEHELPKVLLEHRMLSKLKNTYIDALPKLINPSTGRIHTHFNQAVTATGRLSSSDPNLQNIPIRTAEGRKIREAFVAKDGFDLISLDYSQIELRILADLSKDPVMLKSFKNNEDVHKRTASEVFDVKIDLVSSQQRSFAKTINFGLLYGMGQTRLSQTLGISRKEAKAYIDKYYDRYKKVYQWQEQLLKDAVKKEVVYTFFGRRRKVADINSSNMMLIKRAERIAINTPIQGTAADIIKKAMIETSAFLKKEMPDVKLLLQVHDELILESPHDQTEKAIREVRKIMCTCHPLSVPIIVDGGHGKSWAQAH